MTLRDELDDAIERAFVEPLRIADGEDEAVVRALERGRLASSPDRMRRVVLIQQAVSDVLARSDDRLQARLAQATHALAVLLRLYYEVDDLTPEEIKRRMLDAINDGTRTPEDRRSVAVHESGFAAFAFYLRTAYPQYTDEEIGEEWDGMLGEPERRGWAAIESSRILSEQSVEQEGQ